MYPGISIEDKKIKKRRREIDERKVDTGKRLSIEREREKKYVRIISDEFKLVSTPHVSSSLTALQNSSNRGPHLVWGIQRDTGTTHERPLLFIYLFICFVPLGRRGGGNDFISQYHLSFFFSSVNYIFNFMEIHDTVVCAFRPVGIEYTGDVKGGTE